MNCIGRSLSHPRLRRALLGSIILTSCAAPILAQTTPPPVTVVPLINSLSNELTMGRTKIVYGYFNVTSEAQSISYGSRNYFTPGQQLRFGQPSAFLPGLHNNVFTVDVPFSEAPLSWVVSGVFATADPATAVNYVRKVTRLGASTPSDTYTHTTASAALPSPTLVIEDEGILLMESGTLSTTTTENRGTGTVRLVGGTLSASTSFTNSALLQLEGGELSMPSFTNLAGGHIRVLSGSTILPTFSNAGLLEVTGGTLEVAAGLGLAASGTIRLDGGTLVTSSLANSGGTVDLRAGTLRLTDDNLVTGAEGALGANPLLNGPVTVELATGSTQIAEGTTLTLANGATLATQGGANAGTVTVIASDFSSQSGLFTNQAGRIFYAVNSTLTFAGSGLRNEGTLNLVNTIVHGDVYSPTGTTINVSNTVVFTGDFAGGANFTGNDTAVFAGTYSPGDSPALVTHEGNLAFENTNVLVMEIAGTERGAGYDALDVGGALTFGGTLRIDLLAGFAPAEGMSFDLFDFDPGQSSGIFSDYILPELDDGLAWDIDALYSTGVLGVTAVPEPASVAFLVSAAALTLAACRRRR